ncbi:MAG: type II secretion system protein, partial [Minisyncoccia bacterium]
MNKNHKNKRKGFTLLEILLVIAAIGILAAIVLVAINPTRQIAQVRNAQRRSDINAIYKALEQYLIDNKDYPEGITETPKAICNNTVTTNCVNLSILVPTYIAAIPRDPSGLVYEVYINSDNNRIGVEAPGVELSQSLAVNPISTTTPTPEELIQAQITAGT